MKSVVKFYKLLDNSNMRKNKEIARPAGFKQDTTKYLQSSNSKQMQLANDNSLPTCCISYYWQKIDMGIINKIARTLETAGIKAKIDEWKSTNYASNKSLVRTHIDESDYILLCCNMSFLGAYKYECRFQSRSEVTKIINLLKSHKNTVIPLLLDDTPENSIPDFLHTNIFVDFRNTKQDDAKFADSCFLLLKQILPKPCANIEESENQLAPPDTKPTKLWNTPDRTVFFTGRKSILKQIDYALDGPQLVSITGPTGIGKTTLALEYAHIQNDYQHIYFFSAKNREALLQQYNKFANEHDFAISKISEALLIYDNVTDYDEIQDLIPTNYSIKILITTQSANVINTITLDILTEDESIDLITTLTTNQQSSESKKLAQLLGQHPLAITQACSYIQNQSITIKQYLELYQEQAVALLNNNYLSTSTVASTIKKNLQTIKQQSATADTLLLICSYLDHDNIPLILLTTYLEKQEYSNPKETLADSLKLINKHSLLKVNANSISIHKVFQPIIFYLHTHKERKKILVDLTETIDTLYNNKIIINYKQHNTMIKHLIKINNAISKLEKYGYKSYFLAKKCAIHIKLCLSRSQIFIGDYSAAKEHLLETCSSLSISFKEPGIDTAILWCKAALLYGKMRDFYHQFEYLDTARKIFQTIKQEQDEANLLVLFAKAHLKQPNYVHASTMASAALKLLDSTNIAKRLECTILKETADAELSLATSKMLKEHINTANQFDDNQLDTKLRGKLYQKLSRAYLNEKNYTEAIAAQQQASNCFQKIYPYGSKKITKTLKLLVDIYYAAKSFYKQWSLLEQVLYLEQRIYARPSHPKIAKTIYAFGEMYQQLDNLHLAKKYFEKVLAADLQQASELVDTAKRQIKNINSKLKKDNTVIKNCSYIHRPTVQLTTPPFNQVIFGNLMALSKTLKHDPDKLNAKTDTGYSLLSLAIEYQQPQIISLLLQQGTNPNQTLLINNIQQTIVDLVFWHRYDLSLVKLLLTYGLDYSHIKNQLTEIEYPSTCKRQLDEIDASYSLYNEIYKLHLQSNQQLQTDNIIAAVNSLKQLAAALNTIIIEEQPIANEHYLANYELRLNSCHQQLELHEQNMIAFDNTDDETKTLLLPKQNSTSFFQLQSPVNLGNNTKPNKFKLE